MGLNSHVCYSHKNVVTKTKETRKKNIPSHYLIPIIICSHSFSDQLRVCWSRLGFGGSAEYCGIFTYVQGLIGAGAGAGEGADYLVFLSRFCSDGAVLFCSMSLSSCPEKADYARNIFQTLDVLEYVQQCKHNFSGLNFLLLPFFSFSFLLLLLPLSYPFYPSSSWPSHPSFSTSLSSTSPSSFFLLFPLLFFSAYLTLCKALTQLIMKHIKHASKCKE